MLNLQRTGAFKRDVKRVKKRGKDMDKLRELLVLLVEEKPLPRRCKDHSLKCNVLATLSFVNPSLPLPKS